MTTRRLLVASAGLSALALVCGCTPLIVARQTGSTDAASDGSPDCTAPGSCLMFDPKVTLVQVMWNPNLGTGFPPAGAGKFRIMLSDFPLTCDDVDAAISPDYHTLVIAGDCGMEGSSCAGNMTGPNPLMVGVTVPITQTEIATPEASLAMTAPSGSYHAVAGSVSLTQLSEMSAEVSYTATIEMEGSTHSFALNGSTGSTTYCPGNP